MEEGVVGTAGEGGVGSVRVGRGKGRVWRVGSVGVGRGKRGRGMECDSKKG